MIQMTLVLNNYINFDLIDIFICSNDSDDCNCYHLFVQILFVLNNFFYSVVYILREQR